MHSSAYNDGFVLYWIKATYIKYDICLEILTFVKKESTDDIIAREAATHGASFRYLTESPLIRDGLRSHGFDPPKKKDTHQAVKPPLN